MTSHALKLVFCISAVAMGTQGGVAAAQENPADTSFRDRIVPIDETRTDYFPSNAGYVRLVARPEAIQNAAFCPRSNQVGGWRSAWRASFGIAMSALLERQRVSGAAMRVWQGAATSPTSDYAAFDIPLFTVTVPANWNNCEAQATGGEFRSPLVPLQAGVTPTFSVEFRRWYAVTPNPQAAANIVAAVDQTGSSILRTAGLPAPFADYVAGTSSRLFNYSLVTETGTRFHDALRATNDDRGRRRHRAYVGYRLPSPGVTPSSDDAHVDVQLVTVATLFAAADNHQFDSAADSDVNLSSRSPDALLGHRLDVESIPGSRVPLTVETLVRFTSERDRAWMSWREAQDFQAFTQRCEALRDLLQRPPGQTPGAIAPVFLSDVDIAVTLYAAGRDHPKFGEEGVGPDRNRYSQSPCLVDQAANLARVGIVLSTPPPPLTAATPAEMGETYGYLYAAVGSPSPAIFARQIFADQVFIHDASGPLRMADHRPRDAQVVPFRTVTREEAVALFAQQFSGVPQRLGCFVTSAAGGQRIQWSEPVGDSSWTGLVILLDQATGQAMAARLLFDPAADGQPHLISRVHVTPAVEPWMASAVRANSAYEAQCNPGRWQPSEIYPPVPSDITPP